MKTLLYTLGVISIGFNMAAASHAWSSDNDWVLVFEDDFSGSSLNTHNWSRIDYVDWAAPDWRKYQSQEKDLIEFGVKGDSTMTLWGKYGNYTTQSNQTEARPTYACGGIYTLNTFNFQYGYVEVRAQFDSVQGCWPAIWMMPRKNGSWPANGEIDIMEHLNYQGSFYQTIHYLNSNGAATSQSTAPGFDKTAWHTYGMEWTKEGITFYLDGTATATMTSNSANWPFDDDNNEFYLIIDQQIGGTWVENAGQNKGIDQNTLAQSGAAFNIDYVNVYSSENYMHLIPEPAAASLWLLGMGALTMRRRRH